MPQRSISTTSVCPPINSRSAVGLDRDTLPLERDVRPEEPDHRHRRLLRARNQRPSGRAANERDELAPLHSITSSAREGRVGGTSMPSALASAGLIRNTNLVGCTTGKSAGLVPLRMRPV